MPPGPDSTPDATASAGWPRRVNVILHLPPDGHRWIADLLQATKEHNAFEAIRDQLPPPEDAIRLLTFEAADEQALDRAIEVLQHVEQLSARCDVQFRRFGVLGGDNYYPDGYLTVGLHSPEFPRVRRTIITHLDAVNEELQRSGLTVVAEDLDATIAQLRFAPIPPGYEEQYADLLYDRIAREAQARRAAEISLAQRGGNVFEWAPVVGVSLVDQDNGDIIPLTATLQDETAPGLRQNEQRDLDLTQAVQRILETRGLASAEMNAAVHAWLSEASRLANSDASLDAPAPNIVAFAEDTNANEIIPALKYLLAPMAIAALSEELWPHIWAANQGETRVSEADLNIVSAPANGDDLDDDADPDGDEVTDLPVLRYIRNFLATAETGFEGAPMGTVATRSSIVLTRLAVSVMYLAARRNYPMEALNAPQRTEGPDAARDDLPIRAISELAFDLQAATWSVAQVDELLTSNVASLGLEFLLEITKRVINTSQLEAMRTRDTNNVLNTVVTELVQAQFTAAAALSRNFPDRGYQDLALQSIRALAGLRVGADAPSIAPTARAFARPQLSTAANHLLLSLVLQAASDSRYKPIALQQSFEGADASLDATAMNRLAQSGVVNDYQRVYALLSTIGLLWAAYDPTVNDYPDELRQVGLELGFMDEQQGPVRELFARAVEMRILAQAEMAAEIAQGNEDIATQLQWGHTPAAGPTAGSALNGLWQIIGNWPDVPGRTAKRLTQLTARVAMAGVPPPPNEGYGDMAITGLYGAIQIDLAVDVLVAGFATHPEGSPAGDVTERGIDYVLGWLLMPGALSVATLQQVAIALAADTPDSTGLNVLGRYVFRRLGTALTSSPDNMNPALSGLTELARLYPTGSPNDFEVKVMATLAALAIRNNTTQDVLGRPSGHLIPLIDILLASDAGGMSVAEGLRRIREDAPDKPHVSQHVIELLDFVEFVLLGGADGHSLGEILATAATTVLGDVPAFEPEAIAANTALSVVQLIRSIATMTLAGNTGIERDVEIAALSEVFASMTSATVSHLAESQLINQSQRVGIATILVKAPYGLAQLLPERERRAAVMYANANDAAADDKPALWAAYRDYTQATNDLKTFVFNILGWRPPENPGTPAVPPDPGDKSGPGNASETTATYPPPQIRDGANEGPGTPREGEQARITTLALARVTALRDTAAEHQANDPSGLSTRTVSWLTSSNDTSRLDLRRLCTTRSLRELTDCLQDSPQPPDQVVDELNDTLEVLWNVATQTRLRPRQQKAMAALTTRVAMHQLTIGRKPMTARAAVQLWRALVVADATTREIGRAFLLSNRRHFLAIDAQAATPLIEVALAQAREQTSTERRRETLRAATEILATVSATDDAAPTAALLPLPSPTATAHITDAHTQHSAQLLSALHDSGNELDPQLTARAAVAAAINDPDALLEGAARIAPHDATSAAAFSMAAVMASAQVHDDPCLARDVARLADHVQQTSPDLPITNFVIATGNRVAESARPERSRLVRDVRSHRPSGDAPQLVTACALRAVAQLRQNPRLCRIPGVEQHLKAVEAGLHTQIEDAHTARQPPISGRRQRRPITEQDPAVLNRHQSGSSRAARRAAAQHLQPGVPGQPAESLTRPSRQDRDPEGHPEHTGDRVAVAETIDAPGAADTLGRTLPAAGDR